MRTVNRAPALSAFGHTRDPTREIEWSASIERFQRTGEHDVPAGQRDNCRRLAIAVEIRAFNVDVAAANHSRLSDQLYNAGET